jgi:uncharacterized protein with PIN domain
LKFIADGMLGKLTRWLRMLGHDVEYSPDMDDRALITRAKEERAILLTRDTELYKTAVAKGLPAFFVKEKLEEEQLTELADRFGIDLSIDMTTSRCPKCNTRVKTVPKEKIAGRVEKDTFEYYNEFWRCPKCGQVYWQGAHWARIRKTLENAEQKRVGVGAEEK